MSHWGDCKWFRRALIAAAVVAVLAFVFVTSTKIFAFLDQRSNTDRVVEGQLLKNQHHTDCSITFALGNDPQSCADVKADLADAGIPLTPNQAAASADPRRSPSVILLVCQIAKATGTPPPEGVTCPPPTAEESP